MTHLYQQLAAELQHNIAQGLYRPGDKMPGVRPFSRERGYSIITVISAYRQLEDLGLVEARPRAGYFVRRQPVGRALQAPPTLSQPAAPQPVSGQDLILAMMKASNDPDCIKLGSAVPAPHFFPIQLVQRALQQAAKHYDRLGVYPPPAGIPELRLQLARRMAALGVVATPEQIVVTNGAQEALMLALRAVTKPGDVVAVESPTFYGLLLVLESLGLRAIEIPTHPQHGISPEALQLAADHWPLKACILIANFNNPQGFLLSDERKLALIRLLSSRGIPIIEDDTYGDLGYGPRRPSCLLGLAPDADILYCSTFSKALSPDLRIGWVTSARHQTQLELMKFNSNIATASLPQLAVAQILASGKYERHLRMARSAYQQAVLKMTDRISRLFPSDTRVSVPQGGFVLWLQLPAGVDSLQLTAAALKKGISIAPGPIFSPSQQYRNFIRLSCARVWDARMEYALRTLSELVYAAMPAATGDTVTATPSGTAAGVLSTAS